MSPIYGKTLFCTDKNGFIEITWEPISNSDSDFFYHYEIWRSSNEELTDKTRIAIITDPNQEIFMDRMVGNGTTWYYSLVVIAISVCMAILQNFQSTEQLLCLFLKLVDTEEQH